MNKNTPNKISIVVPVYNVINELDRCVYSLLKQSYKNIEILLIDDGSKDECPQRCDEFATENDCVTVYHKENGGLSDARNYGLERSSGDYVLFVDSDDYIEPETCEKFVKRIEQCDYTPDFIIGDALMIKGDRKIPMVHTALAEDTVYGFNDVVNILIPAQQWHAPAWLNLYRRDYLNENNFRFVKGLLHEDMEFLPRVYMGATRILYMNYTFYNYVIRENSIINTKKKELNGHDLMTIYSEWNELFAKVTDRLVQKNLYGYLVKNYIHTCKELKISNKNDIFPIKGRDIISKSLNLNEKIKAVVGLGLISVDSKRQ